MRLGRALRFVLAGGALLAVLLYALDGDVASHVSPASARSLHPPTSVACGRWLPTQATDNAGLIIAYECTKGNARKMRSSEPVTEESCLLWCLGEASATLGDTESVKHTRPPWCCSLFYPVMVRTLARRLRLERGAPYSRRAAHPCPARSASPRPCLAQMGGVRSEGMCSWRSNSKPVERQLSIVQNGTSAYSPCS